MILAFTEASWLEVMKTVAQLVTPLIGVYVLFLTQKIHKLTNSAMTEQKRLTWVSAETLAATTGHQSHAALASEAKRAYQSTLPENQKNGRK